MDASALSADELIPATDSANHTLQQIDDFEQQLQWLESEVAARQPVPSHPTVEIIGANPKPADIPEKFEQAVASEPDSVPEEELPPITWFAEPATTETAFQTESLTPPTVLAIVNQETGEEIFDVHDFSVSADRIVEPIPNAFEVEPDLFDFKTFDEIVDVDNSAPRTDDPLTTDANPEAQASSTPDDQIFVAGTGDVIQINGNDGFDHIDLACFDVRWATFSDHVIHLDDQQGTTFEVHYQDIAYALFADGVEVSLDADPVPQRP